VVEHINWIDDDKVVPCQRASPHTSDAQSSMKQIPIHQNKLVISFHYLPLQTCSIFSAWSNAILCSDNAFRASLTLKT